MNKTIIVNTPCYGYELLDIGKGRVYEYYGDTLIDRSVLDKSGEAALAEWVPVWRYTRFAAVFEEQQKNAKAHAQWSYDCGGG